MIDRKHVGRVIYRHSVEVEAERLRLFVQAIGATDTAYRDDDAQGSARLRVPPTYLFCLDMARSDPYGWFDTVGLELPKVLHGGQSFSYLAPSYAGDVLTLEAHIDDVYQKNDGALEFVVTATRVRNQRGEHVADMRSVIAQRHR